MIDIFDNQEEVKRSQALFESKLEESKLTPEAVSGSNAGTKLGRLNGLESKANLTEKNIEDLGRYVKTAVESKDKKQILLASKRLSNTEYLIDKLEAALEGVENENPEGVTLECMIACQ